MKCMELRIHCTLLQDQVSGCIDCFLVPNGGAKGMVTHFLLELPTCSKAALGPVRRTNKDRGMSRSYEFLDILHCGRHQSAILRCMSCRLQPVFCLWIDIDPDRRTHFFARCTVAVESLLQFSWHPATAACEPRW